MLTNVVDQNVRTVRSQEWASTTATVIAVKEIVFYNAKQFTREIRSAFLEMWSKNIFCRTAFMAANCINI